MVERLKIALTRARAARAQQVDSVPTDNAYRPNQHHTHLPVPRETDWTSIAEARVEPNKLHEARVAMPVDRNRKEGGFDSLRARLQRLCVQNHWRTIGLTAPTRGCGTTTFALNLGFSFAWRTDAKVLLVDLDVRSPSIATRLGLSVRAKFDSVLSGEANDADFLHRVGENLLLATPAQSGWRYDLSPRDAALRVLIERLCTQYRPDVLLLDLPPVLIDETTTGLLPHMDAALLVTSAEQTSASELDVSARRLSEATNYLGAALNKSRTGSERELRHALV